MRKLVSTCLILACGGLVWYMTGSAMNGGGVCLTLATAWALIALNRPAMNTLSLSLRSPVLKEVDEAGQALWQTLFQPAGPMPQGFELGCFELDGQIYPAVRYPSGEVRRCPVGSVFTEVVEENDTTRVVVDREATILGTWMRSRTDVQKKLPGGYRTIQLRPQLPDRLS